MIFSVRRPQYFISHTKSPRSLVMRHQLSCEKIYKTHTRNVSLGCVWWVRPEGRKDRLIDLKIFLWNILFVWFLWLTFNGCIFLLAFVVLDNRRSIQYFYFSKLQNSVLRSVFWLIVWLHKDPGTRVFELGLNSSELRLVIFHKMSLKSHHNCFWQNHWPCAIVSSTLQAGLVRLKDDVPSAGLRDILYNSTAIDGVIITPESRWSWNWILHLSCIVLK